MPHGSHTPPTKAREICKDYLCADPNVDGLTPGSEVDIWSLDAKRGVFAVVGTGRVSADGSRIETIAGGIRAADWHAPLPLGPAPTGGPGPGPTGPRQCTTCPVASSVTVHNGGLLVEHALPGVRALGVSRSLQLLYTSTTADVRPIVPLDALLSARAAVPPRVSAALEVGGVAQGGRVFYDSRGLPEDADSRSRLALQVDGRALPTGRYPYTVRVFSHYAQSAVGAVLTDQFLVVNHQTSPLGAGWGLAGLQRLDEQPDGSLVLTEGDGTATAFAPSPAENFAAIQFTLIPNGGFETGTGPSADGFSPVGPAVLRRSAETTRFGQFALALDPTFSLPAGQPGAAVVSAPLAVTPGVPYVLSGFILNQIIGGGAAYLDLADAVVDPTLTRPDAPALSTSGLGEWEFVSIRFTPQVTSVQVRAVVDGRTGAIQAGSNVVFDQLALTPASQFHRPPPPALLGNGDFEAGTLSGFTASGLNGGLALVHREGTPFSSDPFPPAGVPSFLLPFNGTFVANVRSSGPAPVDSVGILTSAPFVAGRRVAFLERSESRDVAIEVRVLDANAQVLISQPIAEPSTDRWTRRSVDTGGLVGQTITLQIRQHTLRAGFGFYTLIDDLVADFAPTLFVSPAGDFSTVVRNPDGTVTRTLKDGTRIQFDPQGRQTAIVDRNGNTTRYAYDAAGRLTTVTDPVGQGTTLAYDATGVLQSITDPAGRVTTVAHDAAGNLTQLTNPDGSQVRYAYDAEHRLLTKTDELGQVTRYAYDVAGRLATVTHPTGEGRQLQPTETQGLVNPAGGQGSVATPAPIVRSEAVQASLTDGLGHATTFTVNRFGATLRQTDALGRVTMTVRNAANLPTQVTRPTGAVATMTYDPRGNLLTTTEQALGATTTFSYEPAFNQATAITDPKGHQTTIAYDATGNPTTITDALGHVTMQTYDARGLLTSTRDALGHLTAFTYDATGRLVSTTDPLGRITTLGYDAAGNVVASTDALGRTTQFAYDAMNRLTQVTDAAGGVTRYAYDPKGRLVAVTDARGQTTTFTYDAVGQLVQRTTPLGQVTTFTYDLARNLVLTVDAKGQRLEFTYDVANQLVQKVLKDTAGVVTDTVTFVYDNLGNLGSAADTDSHLTFTSDALGRVTQVQTAATSAQPASTVTYSYDANRNRLTMTDPQGGVITYAYDALNRLTTLTSPDGLTTFGYDALGRRTSLTRPNGTQTTATYDAASQLTDLVHTAGVSTLSRVAYTYDPVGNRATRTTPSGVAAYTYDALSRLTQAQQPDPVDPLQVLTESFAYDPVGNRTASHLATGQVHDAANRLLEDSAFTYQYDLTGNLTSKTAKATGATTTYAYDVENRLVAVAGPGLMASYAYDPLGRRIARTVNGVATRYVYDQEDLLFEYDKANVPQARYTHGPGIDEPLARTDLASGQIAFYQADGLGSITELTDGSGAVVQRYRYDAFGALLASPGTVTQPYTFTGREFDAETGLYYYRARYYDPTLGRFLQEDPIGTDGGLNLYVYVNNNPTNSIDPFGLSPCTNRCSNFLRACYFTATVTGVTVNYVCRALCIVATGGKLTPVCVTLCTGAGVSTAQTLSLYCYRAYFTCLDNCRGKGCENRDLD